MSIITLYEGVLDAEEVAGRVADSLGYRLVGREELVKPLEHHGVPRAKLDEITEKEPHWWEQWLQNLRPYRMALVRAGQRRKHGLPRPCGSRASSRSYPCP